MKRALLLLIMGFGILSMLKSQDTTLIFSEIKLHVYHPTNLTMFTYVEIFNPSFVDTVDLKDYRVVSHYQGHQWPSGKSENFYPGYQSGSKKKVLAPRELYIITAGGERNVDLIETRNRESGIPAVQERADYVTDYYAIPEDSATRLLPKRNIGLLKIGAAKDGSDSLVDVFRFEDDLKQMPLLGLDLGGPVPVAGDPNGTQKLCVRKYRVVKGNPDFNDSRGTNIEDAEWIVLPRQDFWRGDFKSHDINVTPIYESGIEGRVFTTFSNHMNQTKAGLAGRYPGISINEGTKTITVPYGIRRDTIAHVFNINPNVGWELIWSPNWEDSTSFLVHSGDTLVLYICGNKLTLEKYIMQVSEPSPEFNKVFPTIARLRESDEYLEENPGAWPWYYTDRYPGYEVTDGINPIDSVVNIPWGTPVDTLLKYLEKAPKASLDIVWHDGTPSTNVEWGDKLKVTSENGTVKEYLLQINDYAPSHNAFLAAIIIDGDSLESFLRFKTQYTVELPMGTTEIPAVIAVPEDQNATVTTVAAKSLSGSLEDKTTVIEVRAQDDTTFKYVSIIWEPIKDIPLYHGDPFISFISPYFWGFSRGGFNIYNPNVFPVDFSDYLMVNSPAPSLINMINLADSSRMYRPGYKLSRIDKKHYFESALEFPGVTIIGAQGTWMCFHSGSQWYWWRGPLGLGDAFFPDGNPDYPNWVDGTNLSPVPGLYGGIGAEAFALLKIVNNDVLLGTKALEDMTPSDYKILDVVHGFEDVNNWVVGDSAIGKWPYEAFHEHTLIRKTNIYKGNPVDKASFGQDSIGDPSCEWNVYNYQPDYSFVQYYFGTHKVDPITEHLPIVSSVVYIVSGGSSDNESIRGVTDTTNVDQFLANLILSDPDQTLKVANNGKKIGTDLMINGDSLYVTSANGENSTIYIIEVTKEGLEKDASLTSTVYTIGVSTIEGVAFGTTVETIKNNVTTAATATLDIIDSQGQIVPLQWYNTDTVMVKTIATDSIFFRVTAQDGKTVRKYRMVINAQSSDAMVTSNTYVVNESPTRSINVIPQGVTVKTLIRNLIASPGATMKVMNKLHEERVLGTVAFDDYILVTSQDQTVSNKYYLHFIDVPITWYDASLRDLATNGTTVDGFVASQLVYTVRLAPGTTDVPVLTAIANHNKATVVITQAENVTGTEAERTATVHVIAENGTEENIYKVIFEVVTGIDPLAVIEPQIYSIGKTVYIRTESIASGDKVAIFDLTGKLIQIRFLRNTLEEIYMNTPPGVYIVKLINTEQVITSRVTIIE